MDKPADVAELVVPDQVVDVPVVAGQVDKPADVAEQVDKPADVAEQVELVESARPAAAAVLQAQSRASKAKQVLSLVLYLLYHLTGEPSQVWPLLRLHVGRLQHLQGVQGQEEERGLRQAQAGLRPQALPPDSDCPVAAEGDKEDGGPEEEEGDGQHLARLLARLALRHQPPAQGEEEEDPALLGRHLAHLAPRGQPAADLARLDPRVQADAGQVLN